MPVMPQGVVLMMTSKCCLASTFCLSDLGFGLAREGGSFLMRAVDDVDLRALLHQPEYRGPRRAACADARECARP